MDLMAKEQVLGMAIPFVRKVGIYFLIIDGIIAYVGKSINIEARVMIDRQGDKSLRGQVFDHWAWAPCLAADLDQLEQAYIKAFRPRLNKIHAPRELMASVLKEQPSSRPRPIIGPDGTVYPTVSAAFTATGISRTTIVKRATRGILGWSFAVRPAHKNAQKWVRWQEC